MDKSTEDILAGLKTAIEAELTGQAFYANAAENTADPLGKETFYRMAAEERAHLDFLRHQYRSVLEKGGYDLTRKLEKVDPQKAEGPIFSAQIKGRIKDSHFEVSVLTIGMKLEFDAMQYYRSCAEKARGDEVRAFYAELAAWEEGHYRAFERQLASLRDDYFQANSFAPF